LMLILAKKLGIEVHKISDAKDISLSEKSNKVDLEHNFMNSKGLWKNRSIDAKTLRNEVWRIQE
jgi:hypothetical protein